MHPANTTAYKSHTQIIILAMRLSAFACCKSDKLAICHVPATLQSLIALSLSNTAEGSWLSSNRGNPHNPHRNAAHPQLALSLFHNLNTGGKHICSPQISNSPFAGGRDSNVTEVTRSILCLSVHIQVAEARLVTIADIEVPALAIDVPADMPHLKFN